MEEESFRTNVQKLDSLGSVHGSITSLKAMVQPVTQVSEKDYGSTKQKKTFTVIRKSPDYPRIKFDDYIGRERLNEDSKSRVNILRLERIAEVNTNLDEDRLLENIEDFGQFSARRNIAISQNNLSPRKLGPNSYVRRSIVGEV